MFRKTRKNSGEIGCCSNKKMDDCTGCCGSVKNMNNGNGKNPKTLASDALPLPVGLTNKVFFVLFFTSSYFLMRRWREKIRTSMPLHVVSFWELVAIVAQLASFTYLLGFFGIYYVQSFISGSIDDDHVREDDKLMSLVAQEEVAVKPSSPQVQLKGISLGDHEDDDIAAAVCNGTVASHSLESALGNCRRSAWVRRRALEMITGRSLDGLPLDGFDYGSILGQCCELPVGYVQIPVGVAGPLLLDGLEYMVPMSTTEGCLVASTNRGCKAIHMSGGAISVLLKDGMTRAPVVRFPTVKRAAHLKFYVEDPNNYDNLSVIFNRYNHKFLFYFDPFLKHIEYLYLQSPLG